MTRAAIVEDGFVTNIILADESFAASIGAIPCGAAVSIGDAYDDGEFIPPDLESVDLVKYAAFKRWETETSCIVIGGVSVVTDDRSKVMITGARIASDADPLFTTHFKSSEGVFTTIGRAEIVAISDGLLAHIANCFHIEKIVLEEIGLGTITTTDEIDDLFRPLLP